MLMYRHVAQGSETCSSLTEGLMFFVMEVTVGVCSKASINNVK